MKIPLRKRYLFLEHNSDIYLELFMSPGEHEGWNNSVDDGKTYNDVTGKLNHERAYKLIMEQVNAAAKRPRST